MSDPPVNILFPEDLSVLPELPTDPKNPSKIYTDDHMEIWHQKCSKFKVPSVIIVDNFYSNDCGFLNTIEGSVFMELWSRVIREYFREFNYMAQQACLSFSLGYDIDSVELYFR